MGGGDHEDKLAEDTHNVGSTVFEGHRKKSPRQSTSQRAGRAVGHAFYETVSPFSLTPF